MSEPLLEPPKPDANAIADLVDEAREAVLYGDTATAKRLLREVSAALRLAEVRRAEIAEAEQREFGESPP